MKKPKYGKLKSKKKRIGIKSTTVEVRQTQAKETHTGMRHNIIL